MHLVFALIAEGPTDERTLPSILTRTATDILLDVGPTGWFEVQEQVIVLSHSDNASRIEAICKETNTAHLFAVHSDARPRKRADVVATIHDPVRAGAAGRCAFDGHRVVEMIPSPELEGWLLADPDAIARALGFRRWPENRAFVCEPREIEGLDDAKRALDEAVRRLTGPRDNAAPYLEQIASEIDLTRLARLASYQAFSASLRDSLEHVGAFH